MQVSPADHIAVSLTLLMQVQMQQCPACTLLLPELPGSIVVCTSLQSSKMGAFESCLHVMQKEVPVVNVQCWYPCLAALLGFAWQHIAKTGSSGAGTLDTKRASEWVVTTKLGASHRRPGTAAPLPQVRTCRFYAGEMAMSVFVLTAAFYGMISMHRLTFSFFLILQGILQCCRQTCEHCLPCHDRRCH